MWPKPMPNHWILGSVDRRRGRLARSRLRRAHLTDSFTRAHRDRLGDRIRRPASAARPRRTCSSTIAAGALVGHWGGPGHGLRLAEQNAGGSPIDDAGQRLDRRQRRQRYANSQVLARRQVHRAVRQAGGADRRHRRARAAPDTAYAGVVVAARPDGRPRSRRAWRTRWTRRASRRTARAWTRSAARRASRSTRRRTKRSSPTATRNHRVAVIDMTTGAIKRFWGAYGNKPDDADSAAVLRPARRREAVRHPCAAREAVATTEWSTSATRTNDRIQVFKKDGSFVKEKVDRAADARHRLGVGRRVLARPAAEVPLRRRRHEHEDPDARSRSRSRCSRASATADVSPASSTPCTASRPTRRATSTRCETYEGKRVQKFNYKGIGAGDEANEGVLWPAAPRSEAMSTDAETIMRRQSRLVRRDSSRSASDSARSTRTRARTPSRRRASRSIRCGPSRCPTTGCWAT